MKNKKQASSSKVKTGRSAAESTSSGMFLANQSSALLLRAGSALYRVPWGFKNSSVKLHREERVCSHPAPFYCKESLEIAPPIPFTLLYLSPQCDWEGKNGELSRNKLDTSFTARDVGQGSGEDCSFFKMRDIIACFRWLRISQLRGENQ